MICIANVKNFKPPGLAPLGAYAYGPIFSRGAEPSLPKKYFDSARKTAMLTCKIALRD